MLSALRRLFTVILRHPPIPARARRQSPLRAPSSPSPTSPRVTPAPVPSHHIAFEGLGVGSCRSGRPAPKKGPASRSDRA